MEWKVFLAVFVSVFVTEMADKSQLVTLLYSADREVSRLTVFFGAAGALVLTSALGVAVGAVLGEVVEPRVMSLVAGAGFVLIGGWMLVQGFTGN